MRLWMGSPAAEPGLAGSTVLCHARAMAKSQRCAPSLLSPEPLTNATDTICAPAKGGSSNDLMRQWIAERHEGSYDRQFGQQDAGADYTVDKGQLTFDAEEFNLEKSLPMFWPNTLDSLGDPRYGLDGQLLNQESEGE